MLSELKETIDKKTDQHMETYNNNNIWRHIIIIHIIGITEGKEKQM